MRRKISNRAELHAVLGAAGDAVRRLGRPEEVGVHPLVQDLALGISALGAEDQAVVLAQMAGLLFGALRAGHSVDEARRMLVVMYNQNAELVAAAEADGVDANIDRALAALDKLS